MANDDIRQELINVMDLISEPILTMSDDEIIAEAIADGEDPNGVAECVRKSLLETVEEMKMQPKGLIAQHAIISDECRTNRGDSGAIQEAMVRMLKEYHSLMEFHPVGKDTKFHLVLYVEES